MIAQIKLLQSACNSYCLSGDAAFLRWFRSQPQLSEEERFVCFTTIYCSYTRTHRGFFILLLIVPSAPVLSASCFAL